MSGFVTWNGQRIAFENGETVAQALNRSGIQGFGTGRSGQTYAVFCGIGQCQNCLVLADRAEPREACLLPCQDGLVLNPIKRASLE